MHTTTGNWKLGLMLSLATAFMWGVLPIALKSLLEGMDAYTITWYRFLISTLIMAVYVHRKGGHRHLEFSKRSNIILLFIATLGLAGNYIFYLTGLDIISPNSAQVVIQLAPFFLLMGGLLFFNERFIMKQLIGYAFLILGLLLFFNQRYHELFVEFGDYTFGVILVIIAAISWAAYAISLKQLLKGFPSITNMLIIYCGGAMLFTPLAQPASIFDLTRIQLLLLAFCSANSLIAYGSFAEALNHLEASRVSAILAMVPLLTVIFMEISVRTIPDFENPEPLNLLSFIGALLVVSGSIVSSLSRRNATTEQK